MYGDSYTTMRWGAAGEPVWRPPTDVYETEDTAVVIVEIAGLRPGDYAVSLTGRTLVVSGERRDSAGKLGYQQMEIRYGRFRTEVLLPWALDDEGQIASYQDGLLKISLRKAQIRRVPIRVGEDLAE